MTEQNQGLDGIYGVINGKQAPAITGKPIYKEDLKWAEMAGARHMSQLIGQRVSDNDEKTIACPLNFGSRKQTGFMPDDVRLRLLYFKKVFNNCEIQAGIKYSTARPTVEQMKNVPEYKNALEPMLKAFNVTDFDSWLPTVQARFYFEEYEIALLLADEFDQLPMANSTVRVPGALGLMFGELEADDATFTAQTNTKASYLVESKNNVVHTVVTQDLLDDSAPPIIDKIRYEVQRGVGRSYERSIINGDTTAPHQDSDVTNAKDFRKAFKGFRKLAIANEAVVGGGEIVYNHGGSTADKDLFAEMLKRTKCMGDDKSDLIWIMPCHIGHELVTGAIPELFTAFAFGALASNVTGQIPPVFGVKGIESSYMREDLNADGVYDNITKNLMGMLIVKKSRFQRWTRQATKIWAAPSLPSSDTMLMSAKARHSFAGVPQSSDERSVIYARNIAKS